jgi:hypothetical protein
MVTSPRPRRRRIIGLVLAATMVAVGTVASLPVTTKQGVDFEITAHRLPLYRKAFQFLDRDAQYRELATGITQGALSRRERVLAVFKWTARRIQPAPAGWPVVDDHILNVIIRGYGSTDQRADVFATLVTYAGVPAFWQKVTAPGTKDGVILTFVRVDGRWVVIDVANGFVFTNASGELASVEDLAANRAILSEAAASLTIGSTPYSRILTQLRMPPIPRPLRAELQMPWPRLRDEARRAVGRD